MTRARRSFGWIRQLPSGRYQASYTGPDGRRHYGWSTFVYRGDAEAWLRDEEVMVDRAQWIAPARRNPDRVVADVTLGAYAETVIRRRATRARHPIRPTTVDLYRKLLDVADITRKLGHHAIIDITPARVADWYDHLPASTPTQNGNGYLLLKSILAEAVEDELIDRNPCKIKGAGKPAPKREPIALTAGELVAYLTHLPEWARMPLMLAGWCGLRSGEALALRVRDIAPDGTMLKVERTLTRVKDDDGAYRWHYGPPKTAAGIRQVAIPPHLAPAVEAYLSDPRFEDGDVLAFPADGSRERPIHSSALHKAHKKAAVAIGRPTMVIHDLRRTGATLAAQSGATVREMMRMLGHTTYSMAMLYQVADTHRDTLRAQRMSELTTGLGALPAPPGR